MQISFCGFISVPINKKIKQESETKQSFLSTNSQRWGDMKSSEQSKLIFFFFLEIIWGKQEKLFVGRHQCIFHYQACVTDLGWHSLYFHSDLLLPRFFWNGSVHKFYFFLSQQSRNCHSLERFCLLGHHMSVLHLWDACGSEVFFHRFVASTRMSEMFNFHIYNDEKPNPFTTFQDTLNNLQGWTLKCP